MAWRIRGWWIIAFLALATAAALGGEEADPRLDSYGDSLPSGALARLGTVRFRGGGPIMAVLFTPDGKAIVSAGRDSAVRLWDAESGRELHHLECERQAISLALSPDGKTVAVAEEKGRVRLWVPTTGESRILEPSADTSPGCLTFLEGGKVLSAIGLVSGADLRWEVPGGKLLKGIRGRDADLLWWLRAATADGRSFVVAGGNPRPRPINDEGRQAPRKNRRDELTKIVLQTVDAPTELWSRWIDGADVLALATDPTGAYVAVCLSDATILLLDMKTGRVERRLVAAAERAPSMAGSPDGALAFSPDGKTLASGSPRSRHHDPIKLWDVATGEVIRRLPADDWRTACVAFSPDGRTLATCSSGPAVRLWDVGNGRESQLRDGHREGIDALAVAPDGRTLVTGGREGVIWEWPSTGAGHGRKVATCESNIQLVAYSPDGSTLGALVFGRNAQTLDVATGRPSRLADLDPETPPGWPEPTWSGLSPDGRFQAVGAPRWPPGLRVVEVATGADVVHMEGEKESATDRFAFSPDGRLLATGTFFYPRGELPTAVIWDAASGRALRRLTGHRGQVTAVAFLGDRERLITASADASALIWDVSNVVPPAGNILRTDADLEALWDALGGEAAPAYRSIWALADAPARSVPFLRERLRPGAPGPERLRSDRALAALERAGTEEARLAIETFAAAAPESKESKSAAAAIKRLDKGPVRPR